MTLTASPADEPPELSDLLDRVIDGDERARLRFFEVYAPLVFRFVLFTFGLDDDEAEDVVQETMLAAFSSISSFDRSRKVKTWLFAIAKNKAIDFLRSRMRTDLDEPVRAEVPWSTIGLEDPGGANGDLTEEDEGGSDAAIEAGDGDDGGRALEDIEASLGEAAVGEEDPPRGVQGADLPISGLPAKASAPPAPPSIPSVSEPYRAWAREIEEWLATQPQDTRIIIRRFTHEATYEQLTKDLAEHLGKPVTEEAVRQRVSRFKRDFRKRFEHLLPPSRVRLPDEAGRRKARAPAG